MPVPKPTDFNVPLDSCIRIAEASSKACSASVASVSASAANVAHGAAPDWDAVANSFASLSAAFAWGSILLAFFAVVGLVGWGLHVKVWAEKLAKEEAKECTKEYINKWLSEEAPAIIRRHVELLKNTSLGKDDDDKAADNIGKEAG